MFFLRTMLFVGPYTFVPLEYFINSSSIVLLKQAEIYKYFFHEFGLFDFVLSIENFCFTYSFKIAG